MFFFHFLQGLLDIIMKLFFHVRAPIPLLMILFRTVLCVRRDDQRRDTLRMSFDCQLSEELLTVSAKVETEAPDK